MVSPLPLSILDVIPVAEGASSAVAIRASLALARAADRLGYTRQWFAEHHNMAAIGSTTPALMVALAAEQTVGLRLGAGGVMLPNHAPLAVAETWKMLAALAPEPEIDAPGRAPGTDQVTALALRRDPAALTVDDFPERLAELRAFGDGSFPPGHPFASVTAMPDDAPLPPLTLLGSSDYSARLAARLGLAFGFAAHFSAEPAVGPMRLYREGFRAGPLARPHAILTLAVVCAEDEVAARRVAASMELVWVRLRTRGRATRPAPHAARARRSVQGRR
jgi:luciferase family oxidoreductase group 1